MDMFYHTKSFLSVVICALLTLSLPTKATNPPPKPKKIRLKYAVKDSKGVLKELNKMKNASGNNKLISCRLVDPKESPEFDYNFWIDITEDDFNAEKTRLKLPKDNNKLTVKQVEKVVNYYLLKRGFEYKATIELGTTFKDEDDTVFGPNKLSFKAKDTSKDVIRVNLQSTDTHIANMIALIFLSGILIQLYLFKVEKNDKAQVVKPIRELLSYKTSE